MLRESNLSSRSSNVMAGNRKPALRAAHKQIPVAHAARVVCPGLLTVDRQWPSGQTDLRLVCDANQPCRNVFESGIDSVSATKAKIDQRDDNHKFLGRKYQFPDLCPRTAL